MSLLIRTAAAALPLLWLQVRPLAQAQPGAQERARIFARLPNWSGLWETDISADLSLGKLASGDPVKADSRPGAGLDPIEQAFLQRMVIIGKPPYNAEWAQKSRAPVPPGASPGQTPLTVKICSAAFPAMMDSPTPDGMFEALVTPEQTLLVFPGGEVRHIYTDGRPHPRKEDLWPTALGDSIGRWEGTTLVVDTVAHIAGAVAPLPGAANLSAQARFTERIHLIDAHTMRNDLTIDDPARFEHPWQLTIRYVRVTDVDRMIPTSCAENDRNPVVDGKIVIAPPTQ